MADAWRSPTEDRSSSSRPRAPASVDRSAPRPTSCIPATGHRTAGGLPVSRAIGVRGARRLLRQPVAERRRAHPGGRRSPRRGDATDTRSIAALCGPLTDGDSISCRTGKAPATSIRSESPNRGRRAAIRSAPRRDWACTRWPSPPTGEGWRTGVLGARQHLVRAHFLRGTAGSVSRTRRDERHPDHRGDARDAGRPLAALRLQSPWLVRHLSRRARRRRGRAADRRPR